MDFKGNELLKRIIKKYFVRRTVACLFIGFISVVRK